jgi:hypothetical protein
MEPLDDKELKQILNKWEAPKAPARLTHRVLPQPMSWREWMFKGSIRVPVPVGVAAVVVLVLWILFGRLAPTPAPIVQAPTSSTLADFQPVDQLEPTIERNNKNDSQYK